MKIQLKSAIIFIIGLFSSGAFAMPLYLNAALNFDAMGGSGFIAYYDSRQAGAGDTMGSCFNCNICHQGPGIPSSTNTNVYGSDFLAAWLVLEPGRQNGVNPDKYSVAAMMAIETGPVASGSTKGDSDNDGFSNIAEILGGSNPGDPTSTPNNPNCQTGGGVTAFANGGGSQSYNPNALNGNCAFSRGAAAGSLQSKEDPKRVLESILPYMLPLFMLGFLRIRRVRRVRVRA
jgi:hypothetical protein